MFIYQWWLQTTVIFVNYSGRPYMESISENKKTLAYAFLHVHDGNCFDFQYEYRITRIA